MNIIVKAVAGSHLFGTNTENSDKDYKGVYMPEAEDILLQKVKGSITIKTGDGKTKNTKDDVDIEFYSLQKFMNMLYEGQTGAIELLFTPEEMIIETSPTWKFLQEHRHELLHKNVTSFVGYCKTQADKYGVRGSRMATVKTCIAMMSNYNPGTTLEAFLWDNAKEIIGLEHVKSFNNGHGNLLEICNRKFNMNITLCETLKTLTTIYNNYGERSRMAMNNEGIDWKALSHAYRVCVQAYEILKYHSLTLPLIPPAREGVLRIKQGTLTFAEVRELLEVAMADICDLEITSTLRDKIDTEKWNGFLLVEYANETGQVYPLMTRKV